MIRKKKVSRRSSKKVVAKRGRKKEENSSICKKEVKRMKENKVRQVNFNDGKKDVYGKIKSYEIGGMRFIEGKGYYIDRSFDKWVVYETNIDISCTDSLRTGNSWEVFKTKNREKAIEVAKFLAERVEVD